MEDSTHADKGNTNKNMQQYLFMSFQTGVLAWFPFITNSTTTTQNTKTWFPLRLTFLLVTRYSLLVTSYFLLVTRCFLLVNRYSLFFTRYSLHFTRYSLLVIFYSLLVAFLLVTRYLLLVTHFFSLLIAVLLEHVFNQIRSVF